MSILSRYVIFLFLSILFNELKAAEIHQTVHTAEPLLLGQGVSWPDKGLKSVCINGKAENSIAMATKLFVHEPLTQNEFISALGVGEPNLFPVLPEIENYLGTYVNATENPDELQVYFMAEVGGLSQSLKSINESPLAEGIHTGIADTCGHLFIKKIHYAARVIVSVRFQFESVAVKNRFLAETQLLASDMVSFARDLSLIEKLGRTKITVAASQVGGSPRALSSVLAPYLGQLVCGADSPEPCQQTLLSLHGYMTLPSQFFQQVKTLATSSELLSSAAAPVGIVLEGYLGVVNRLASPVPVLKDSEAAAVHELQQLHRQELKHLSLSRRNIQHPDTIDMNKKIISRSMTRAESNLRAIKQALDACNRDFRQCPAIKAGLALQAYPARDVHRHPSFLQLCLRQSKNLDEELNIQAILSHFKTASCSDAWLRLVHAEILNLQDLGLTNLAYLYGAEAVTQLNLAHNELREIDLVSHFPKIKLLHLSHNKIAKLPADFWALPLDIVYLDFNRITDVTQLCTNPLSYQQLTLYRNPLALPVDLSCLSKSRTRIIRNDTEACKFERKKLLNAGAISLTIYEKMERENLGPEYRPGDSSGIRWSSCSLAIETFHWNSTFNE